MLDQTTLNGDTFFPNSNTTFKTMRFSLIPSILSAIFIFLGLEVHAEEDRLYNLIDSIRESESNHSDLRKSAEKEIRWFSGNIRPTSFSIVYIHGFSASKMELSPTVELIADQLGANVFFTRLSGHGRSEDAMAEASVQNWKRDIDEAIDIANLIGNRVIIMSASTGSTLATWWLATRPNSNIAANIMISPNFGVNSSAAQILTWPMGLTIGKFLSGDYRGFEPQNQLHAEYWTERYPLEAVVPMLELVDEVDDLDKAGVTTPQLIVYSENDKVVSVEKIKNTTNQFSASNTQLVNFQNSTDPAQHVLSGEACSPTSTSAMVETVLNYLRDQQL